MSAILYFVCERSKGHNGLMQSSRAHDNFFSYFSASACDIKCFETEMVLSINNLCV